ncbi:MAG TPA: LptF/LptG family permease [Terriglobales bacterium]|nr:LptF/LptG family permease [Terriglobales bacterium]
MKILHRYIRREVAASAGVGLLLFTFVIFMQDLGRALEAAVQVSGSALGKLVADVLPSALVFTMPMALLVGVLIGLGRLSVDGELTAMRASGTSSRSLLRPMLELAGAALALSLLITLWWAPTARQRLNLLTTQLASTQIASSIQPRVFFEPDNNPDWVIYTGDANGTQWRQVLVADMKNRTTPELTMAAEGRLISRGPGEVQLHLARGAQYQLDPQRPGASMVSAFETVDIPFSMPASTAGSTTLSAMPLGALWHRARFAPDWRAARVEFHRRWALAFATLALAMLGMALGLRGGRGGKAGGFVLTLLLVLSYYLLFVLGLALAKQGNLPPWLGAWGANLIFLAAAGWSLSCLDRIPARPIAGADPVAWIRAGISQRRAHLPTPALGKRRWLPAALDRYVVREFLAYTGLLLAAFWLLVVVFTLFELIGSVLQHHIGVGVVIQYLLYFSPQTLYLMAPLAILAGVMITVGLMSKSNEVTAMKASGISVYRVLAPMAIAACVLCCLQFGLDATWLPGFNQKQDALHAVIKGQPAQTYRNPEHKWVFGQSNDIYYFSFFDPSQAAFADVSVFEFDPQSFELTRRIFARQARWDDGIQGWVFTNGWARQFQGPTSTSYQPFLVASFPGLPESPQYFATDSRQGTQMSFGELHRYIGALRASGYTVGRLSITLWKKLAYPLITVVMALLAFPFALTVGRRGTLVGVSVGIVVAIAYWSTASLLEALGNLNQLPAPVAAWAPDALFLGLGLYFLLRVPT